MISRTGFVAIILVCATLGCASHSRTAKVQDPKAKILWSHRYQYIRIEPREHCDASATAANQHPYVFKSGQLEAILDYLRIDRPDEEKNIPLFSRAEKAVLIEPLVKAFQQATADEDIGLVIEGAHPGSIGFRNSITTARLFIQNGELQIVFGKLHEPNDEYDTPFHAETRDYRLFPFFPGSRCEKAGKKFPAIIANNIVRFHDQEGTPRKNWLVVSLSAQSQQPPMPMTAPPVYRAAPPAAPPAVQTPARTMPQAYQAPMQMEPPASQDAESRMMPPAVQQPPRTILQRLQILKDLRVKGVITEQEYQEKKKEILDSL